MAGRPPQQATSAPRGRGRPPSRDAAETRASIIAAAQRLFGEHGYEGTSMEAVATACGLNARALYYHFPSKRALFDTAADEAFARFGDEVASRVFTRVALRDRVTGYVDVYRALHATDPGLLSFIGVVLVDALGAATPAAKAGGEEEGTGGRDDALRLFLETLVDDAFARGEVDPSLDREGAMLLLMAIGMGLSLASLGDPPAFPAMLDALDRLTTGTLFRDP